jgi:hypothetical protein
MRPWPAAVSGKVRPKPYSGILIVGPHPLSSGALNVVKVVPVILGQPLVAYGPFDPFHIGICCGLPGWMYSGLIPQAPADWTFAALRYSGAVVSADG